MQSFESIKHYDLFIFSQSRTTRFDCIKHQSTNDNKDIIDQDIPYSGKFNLEFGELSMIVIYFDLNIIVSQNGKNTERCIVYFCQRRWYLVYWFQRCGLFGCWNSTIFWLSFSQSPCGCTIPADINFLFPTQTPQYIIKQSDRRNFNIFKT